MSSLILKVAVAQTWCCAMNIGVLSWHHPDLRVEFSQLTLLKLYCNNLACSHTSMDAQACIYDEAWLFLRDSQRDIGSFVTAPPGCPICHVTNFRANLPENLLQTTKSQFVIKFAWPVDWHFHKFFSYLRFATKFAQPVEMLLKVKVCLCVHFSVSVR